MLQFERCDKDLIESVPFVRCDKDSIESVPFARCDNDLIESVPFARRDNDLIESVPFARRQKDFVGSARFARRFVSRGCCLAGLACILAWGLPGCTSLQGDYQQPEVTVTSFRAVPSAGSALNFEIDLRVVNPNRDALELQGVAYTITLEGRKLVTGVGKDLPRIDGYSEGLFTLTASASLFEALQLIGDFMTEPKDRIRYDLETKLDIGKFRPAIRVRDSGEISLQPTQPE